MNLLKLLTRIIDDVNQFIKNVTKLRRKYIYIWIEIGYQLSLKSDSRKVWKMVKKKKKIKKKINQYFAVFHPIRNNNNELISSIDEKLKILTFSL